MIATETRRHREEETLESPEGFDSCLLGGFAYSEFSLCLCASVAISI